MYSKLLLERIRSPTLIHWYVEMAVENVGLHANCKKMEYMLFDQGETDLKALSGDLLKQVHDLKYLGWWIADSKKDMEV